MTESVGGVFTDGLQEFAGRAYDRRFKTRLPAHPLNLYSICGIGNVSKNLGYRKFKAVDGRAFR